MPLLFKKTDLLDDDDWSDPAEVEPPAERQFELRETTALKFDFRSAGRLEIIGAADVEVLAKFPPASGRGRPSWAPIGVKSITDSRAPLKLDVGGYTQLAVRFTNIVAPGAAYVEVNGQPWRVGLSPSLILTEALAAATTAQATAEAAQATADAHASRHSFNGADEIALADLGDFASRTDNGKIVTFPRMLTLATPLASGYTYGCVALVRETKEYTGLRFCLRGGATTCTYMRAGVYSSDGSTLLAQTAELNALNGPNQLIAALLDTPLELTKGSEVVLAFAMTFTGNPSVQGRSHNNVITVNLGGVVYSLASTTANLGASGLPATISSASTAANIFPWIEAY